MTSFIMTSFYNDVTYNDVTLEIGCQFLLFLLSLATKCGLYNFLGPLQSVCNSYTCTFGGFCLDVQGSGIETCVCDFNCTTSRRNEICASDGKIYKSLCHMDQASCEQQKYIYEWALLHGCSYDGIIRELPSPSRTQNSSLSLSLPIQDPEFEPRPSHPEPRIRA